MKAIIHRKHKPSTEPQWVPVGNTQFKWIKARCPEDPDKLEYYALPSPYGVVYVETIHGGVSYSRFKFFEEEYEMLKDVEVTMTLTEFI